METKKIGKESFKDWNGAWTYREDSLIHDGNVEIDGEMGTVVFLKKMYVTGSILVHRGTSVEVRENIEIGQNINARDDIYSGQNITAGGDICVGGVTAHGDISAGGKIIAKDVYAGGKIEAKGKIKASRNILALYGK